MLGEFDAHKAVHEAAEHLHHARLGALCAALLAVAAAIANLLANKSATAVVAQARGKGGVALFEIAIALVSISAPMSSTFLLAFAGAASIGGFPISAYGFTLR